MTIVVDIFLSAIKNPRKLFFSMLVLNIIDWSVTFSQRQYSTFSTIDELTVGSSCQNIVTGDFNGDGLWDIVTYRSKYLTVLYATDDTLGWTAKAYRFDKEILVAIAADVNNDGQSDLTMLTSDPLTLKVFLGTQKDTLILKWKFILEGDSFNLNVNDINNDGKNDILLFGKKITGIMTFLGKGNGTFKIPQYLIPEFSFSNIFINDINNDGLVDVIGVNWLSNQINLFTSYARLKYNIPSTIDFMYEPITVLPTQINGDGITDIIVGFQDERLITTMLGDGLGNYFPHQDIELLNTYDKMIIADIDYGGTDEMVTIHKSKGYLSLWIKDSLGYFSENAQYSLGRNSGDAALIYHPKTNYCDLLFTNTREKKLNYVYNSKVSLPAKNDVKYITGVRPTSIRAIDILHSGNIDLVIANEGSKSISIFKNNTTGVFDGQVCIQTPIDYPKSLNVKVKKPGLFFALTTHANSNQISVTEVTLADYSHSSYDLTMADTPEILEINFSVPNNYLYFSVGTRDLDDKYYNVFLYERISRTKFTEKEITQALSAKVINCTAQDINNDGRTDLVYLKNNSKNSISSCIAFSYVQNIKPINKCVYTLKDTNSGNYLLFGNDIDSDGLVDIMLSSSDKNELNIFLNRGDSIFYSVPNYKISNIKINNKNDIQFIDVDNDKKVDMIVENALTKTLQAFIAKGNGIFHSPKRLMGIEGVSSFVVADFDNDGLPDFALTYENDGYVRIIYGRK
jgi:hypothetical protein